MKQNKTRYDTKTLVTMAMLTAMAFAVMAVCKVIPKVGGFLSLDAIDAVIGVGGFLFGPGAAVMMIVVEALIEMVTPLSTTGWYGFVMNVLSTVLLICPAVMIYQRKGKTSGAVIGLAVGVLFRLLGMIVFNYIVTPLYFGMPRAAVGELMPMIAGFNLVKGVLNAALLMVIYPPVSTVLRRTGLVAPSKAGESAQGRRFDYLPLTVSLLVLVGAVLVVLNMLEVL